MKTSMDDSMGSIISMVALLLLLASACDGHGQHHSHRSLLGSGQGRGNGNGNGFGNGNGNGKGSGRSNKNNRHGWKFDFSDAEGGARGYLTRLAESKMQRLRQNSRFEGQLDELAKILDEDDDFGIDTTSDAFIYACENIEPPAADNTLVTAPGEVLDLVNGTEDANDQDPSTANVWTLASRPSSRKKIWLDFRGGNITGTAWLSGANITWPPYDFDGNPRFTTAELRAIVAIWRAVSEDFAPFNVDVTTINQIALRRAYSTYMRVAIGGSSSNVLNVQTGGTAFVGVYGDASGLYQPAWVFASNLRGGDPKAVWEAVSHEVGHTMGLYHDGIALNGVVLGYYTGSNNWAPVMGVGYNQAVTQWSKGDYLNATQTQDDLAIIAAKLGYAQSSNGNTAATATQLVPSPTTTNGTVWAAANGIIIRPNRADYFALNASNGSLTVSVTSIPGYVPQAGVSVSRTNLNAQITVLNSSLGTIGVWDDPLKLTAARTFALRANGTYYIAVRGVGSGNATTLSGYSSYGSLGQFLLNTTYRGL